MNDDILNSLQAERSEASLSHIMVIGVGGGGSNAVNYMRDLHIEDVNYMVCNTDRQALDISPVELKIRLGASGDGAGNDPAEGRRAAIESLDIIKQNFENLSTKMVFIAASMGGGTGTGASPVIATAAREMGILTVGIVTTPIRDEGPKRYRQALEGIEALRKSVDSLLIIDSDHIAHLAAGMNFNDAMSLSDKVLATSVKGIAEIITISSSRTNIDFADVSKVMTNSGRTHMGVGRASGENRAEIAALSSLNSPLLDSNAIRGARSVLVNISCKDSNTLMYKDLTDVLKVIQAEAKYVDDNGEECSADIIWGNSEKPNLDDDLEVVVVATNFAEIDPDANKPKEMAHNSPATQSPSAESDNVSEVAPENGDADGGENGGKSEVKQTTSIDIWDDIKRFVQRIIDGIEDLDNHPDCDF